MKSLFIIFIIIITIITKHHFPVSFFRNRNNVIDSDSSFDDFDMETRRLPLKKRARPSYFEFSSDDDQGIEDSQQYLSVENRHDLTSGYDDFF